jgi:hypothetical protein
MFFAKLSLARVAKLSTCPEIPSQANNFRTAGRTKIRPINCEDRHDVRCPFKINLPRIINLLPFPLVTRLIFNATESRGLGKQRLNAKLRPTMSLKTRQFEKI